MQSNSKRGLISSADSSPSAEFKEALKLRAVQYFKRYGSEMRSVSQLLQIRLEQLALAYTLQHKLPREAVQVHTRVKLLENLMKKAARLGWPDFKSPEEIASDLIGARVICWFLDDCYGMLESIRNSAHLRVRARTITDYIKQPKPSGYRSIHLQAALEFDAIVQQGQRSVLTARRRSCEIQIRTKLQDAWSEFTHDIHYKAPMDFEEDYETLVSEFAARLASEDRSGVALRNLLIRSQRQPAKKD